MSHATHAAADRHPIPGRGETLKFFSLFSFVSLVLLGASGELAFRGLSLRVLEQRVGVGHLEAEQIARQIAELGADGETIDYARLRRQRDRIRDLIVQRIANKGFVQHVEVLDRFGAPLVRVDGQGASSIPRDGVAAEGTWPSLPDGLIQVPLTRQSTRPEGEVRLRFSQDRVRRELQDLRQSLWIQFGVVLAAALAALGFALFYVLHLIKKNRTLEQARQSADRRSYVGILASGLAHEIRNPLNAMSMNVQMLEEELLERPDLVTTDAPELLASTRNEIKRLDQLVNNFLSFARPAAPRFEPLDLNQIVNEVLRFLEADFRQHHVVLETDLEPLLPPVELDATQFKQALMNLLVNARQVLADGGQVTVRTRAGAGGEAVVEIQDDGPGIPPDARERIFEVFYSNRGGGTGLGLPIARQVIERHGGKIELETELGQGSTFRIRLPRRHVGNVGRKATP